MTLCFLWLNSFNREITEDAIFNKHQLEHDDLTGIMKKEGSKKKKVSTAKLSWHKTISECKGKRENLSPAFVAYVRHEVEKIIVEALMGISLINEKYIVDADSFHLYNAASTSMDPHPSISSGSTDGGRSNEAADSDGEDDNARGMHHIGHSKSFWGIDDGFPWYKFDGAQSISVATGTEIDSLEKEEVVDEEESDEPSLIFGDALDELHLDDPDN